MNACRNIRFIASAGTGKTHQVVSLYQALLFGRPYPADDQSLPGIKAGSIFDGQSRIAPERILMLTFTKNAAAEMRSRVTEAIEKELATGLPENEAFCWNLLRRLSSATISTIHSFAQQILSSHTLFLGLSPNLTILEEAEAEDLRAEIIEAALKAALVGTDPRYANDMEILCDGRGVKGIEASVVKTLRTCAAWGLDLSTSEPASLVSPSSPPALKDLEALLSPISVAASARSGKTLKTMATELTAALKRLAANPPPDAIVKAAGDLRVFTTSSWGSDEGVKELRKEVQGKLDALAAYPDQLTATHLLVSFLTLARDCARHIQARKRAQGVLDFDDLLFKARELIEARPDVAPALDVIIVDEAQDNSRLQNDLIRLVQSASNAAMVMCGDTKQTIYGWRGADSEGLPRFAKAMSLDDVPLRTSYRSQKGILDWVNDIFSGVVLGVGQYGENETLAPCSAAQPLKGPAVELLLPEWEWGPKPGDSIPAGKKGDPKLRLTLTPKDVRTLAENDPDFQAAAELTEKAIELEARAVARRIRLLTTNNAGTAWHPSHIWDSSRSEWTQTTAKPYRFRDILILLRASTRQEIYEQALQEEGIPFTTDGKGRGFFARQEVLDVANLLSWLAYPTDQLSWLGLLRSPFVALSDNAIAAIGPMFKDLRFEISDAADVAAFRRAKTVLARLQSLAGRVSAVDLVREAIRLTGYDAILVGTFHGVQRLANLQKLLSWIQTCERDETLNLQETAKRLSGEITRGREAPDAAVLDPDDDSVRINTVHAAKGLSSPVVILPDLRRAPNSDRDWILVTRDAGGEASGVAGKIKQYADDDAQELESASYSDASDRNKNDRDHESRRLFYVACTRARDLLILSGENPGNGSKDAWRSWINQHLVQCDFNTSLIQLRPYGEVEQAWRKIATITPAQITPTPESFMTVSDKHPGSGRRERYRFPITALASAIPLENPDKEERAFPLRLALAPVSISPASREDQEVPEAVPDRSQLGTLAHRILETLDYASPIPLALQIEQSPEWNDAGITERKLIAVQIESAAQTLTGMLAGVAPEQLIRELPFAARFTHNDTELIVDGKADLLFLKNGVWHIVDYKFSNHEANTLKARYALQLAAYREALSAPTSDPALRTPRFSTPSPEAAPFKLVLLGINSKGGCTEMDVSGTSSANISSILIQAARDLAN